MRQSAILPFLCVAILINPGQLPAADTPWYSHVMVISIDGMHSLDFALWIKKNPTSNIAKLAAQSINYTNAFGTQPGDSIPATVAMFTGGSPAISGMYYDDAYNRAWFAPTNTNCTGTPGVVTSLKQDISTNPLDSVNSGTVDPAKSPRVLVNGVCTPLLPHQQLRINTVFEVARQYNLHTAYSEKRPPYEFLNGPSGAGVQDLFVPEIGATILADVAKTEAFDQERVVTVLNEIDGKNSLGTATALVPVIYGMNFQCINAAKKDSIGNGYADSIGTPNAVMAAELQYVDNAIGQFVAELAKMNLTSSTAIILMAKHGESSLDPTHRNVQLTTAVQSAIVAAGIPANVIAHTTQKSTEFIWLTDQTQTEAVAKTLLAPDTQKALNIARVLYGESLKLVFPDPLVDPAVPDIIVVPNEGTNYETSLNTALPATQAEHGGFNENERHVPLIVYAPWLRPNVVRAPVNTSQVAPTILTLLGLFPASLQAVQLEGVTALPGVALNLPFN